MTAANPSREIPILINTGAVSETTDNHTHAVGLSAPLPGPAPVWLRVAGRPIDEAEIAREMQMHRAASPQQAREEAARTLVVRELIRLECERLGIVPAPETGETNEEAMVRQLLDRDVVSAVPDAQGIQRYYEANRDRLHRPDRANIAHILIAAAPDDINARLQAREQAQTLIAQLQQAPGRFAEFAALHSACPSSEQGGELGWIERGDTVPEFERQIFMLREGLAGLSVETRYGHHVVHVLKIEHGAALSFDEAAPIVSAYLETQARQNAIHDYLLNLRERWSVEGWEHIAQEYQR